MRVFPARFGFLGKLAILVLALGLGTPAPSPLFGISVAVAQEQGRGGLFGLLFGSRPRNDRDRRVIGRVGEEPRELRRNRRARQQEERAGRPSRSRETRAARRKSRERKPAIARAVREAEPEAAPVEKLDNARKVLVVGDFLAGGLAEGLTTVFEQSPGVAIVDRSNGSSGLVRDDFHNWPEEIGPLIEAEKPSVVVVMIGSNDRQELRVAGEKEAVRSPAWAAEYQARIKRLVGEVRENNIPLVWVGMPAFKSKSMTSDMLAFNDFYRQAVEEAGGTFVDIWDGFVDENGGFIVTGPDINGQPVKLRSGDGINLTRPGRRKVAFYAEKPLKKILGDAVSPDVGTLGPESLPELVLGPVVSPEVGEIERTQPISLTDPDFDGGSDLLGAAVQAKPDGTLSPAERLSVEGIAPPPQPGRADDFRRADMAPDDTTSDVKVTPLVTE